MRSPSSPLPCAAGLFSAGRLAVVLLFLLIAGTALAKHPLEPVDTSSPRATMTSFLRLTEETADRYFEFRDSPGPRTQSALWQVTDKVGRLFDLSEVPPAARRKVSDETFYLLWEVIARLELPDFAEIPDASADQADSETAGPVTRWRIPATAITIARVEEGPRAGEFLFSPDTVKQAQRFYDLTCEQAYVREMPIDNVYRLNQLATGWMIPPAWVEALPEWTNTAVFGQVLWKWFVLLLLVGITFAAVITVFRWARRKPWDGSLRAYLRHLSTPLAIAVFAWLVRFLARDQINVTGSVAEAPDYIREIASGVAAVWAVWITARWIAETIIASPKISSRSLDAHLLRLASRCVGLLAAVVLVFRVCNEVGIPVYGLVAGAGVGGLAVALASKNTIENFVASLHLFADRPVRVGDLCCYDENHGDGWRPVGQVESIGLRSTRIRDFQRGRITIPNAEFAQRQIVNFSACDRRLLSTTLGLRYETTDDQLRFVLAELRTLLHGHPKTVHTRKDPLRVRFVGFGECSLNVEVRTYLQTTNHHEFLAIQEDLFLRFMKIITQAGTGFAFPSRTVYHTRDRGLDQKQQDEAEGRVREWVAGQTLPFPEFADDYLESIKNTLDYPPEGSPGGASSGSPSNTKPRGRQIGNG